MSAASRQVSAASTGGETPLMRTVLSEFCNSFDATMRPILNPIHRAAEALAAAPADSPARRVLPTLRDLRHQLEALVGKVAEQQGYVLIFGPLKSGKSTFMNALSAEYVSEVTSLPAYPCMVYVSHSDTPGFVITQYDGRTLEFTQREALSEVVENGHHELTRRIREVEAAGESFDPVVHMPEAIRRIDVKIEIEDLAQSGAVLVDTPGLYTRMKFGYERMTRDFRNSAACAIFIVKTDNLFLEQVFNEFGELLELFSRIFLLVNVDSNKNDLKPDGTLAPSLEQKNPWEVIEAFESLSMTTPLKQAVEEGRLEIYPIDLLKAASHRIRARAQGASAEADAESGEGHGPTEFEHVLRDLTEFLNSNEYLTAFVDDSLRRSRTLLDELGTALEDDAVQQLGPEIEELTAARDAAQTRLETVERLRGISWSGHVEGLAPSLIDRASQLAGQVKADAATAIEQALDEWFETPESLHHLLDGELRPVFAATHSRLVREAEDALKRRASEDFEGIAATEHLLADLESVGIDMRATADTALHELKLHAATTSPHLRLWPEDIPVRRSASDWLLLRSGSKVRSRLFGPPQQPNVQIPPATKMRVLGHRGRQAIRDIAVAQLEALLDDTARGLPDQLVRGYAERFEHDLQTQLERIETETRQRLDDTAQRLERLEAAREGLHGVAGELGPVSVSVDSLIERFGRNHASASSRHAG